MSCICKYQYNIICGSCKKPFKIPTNREERISDLQRIITRYIIRSGFSVGISDLIIPREILQTYEEAILQGKKDNIELTKKVHLNILEDITEDLDLLYNYI